MEKSKTILMKICAWCGIPMGDIDGKGVEGITYCICPKCADKEWTKLGGRPPKRWNFIGRLIYHFRQRNAYLKELEAEKTRLIEKKHLEKETKTAEQIVASDPNFHAFLMLKGIRMIHYLNSWDISELKLILNELKDQPEMKARWN